MKMEELKRKKKDEDDRFSRKINADREAEIRRLEEERKRQEERRRKEKEAAMRRAEEERRRKEEEERKAREVEQKRKEASAGITFSGCKFGNTDFECNVLSAFGGPLYSDEMRYLGAKYDYTAEKAVTGVEFLIKLYKPSKELMRSDTSPAGYTTLAKVDVEKGDWSNHYFFGWGNSEQSSYPPGEYVVEIWRNGYMLYSSVALIKSGPRPK